MRTLLFLALLAVAGHVYAQEIPQVTTVVFRVDYLSFEPERYYEATDTYRSRLPAQGAETAARLYYYIYPPADFGYTEVFSTLTGQRVMGAGTVWLGTGTFDYPSGPGSTEFGEKSAPIEIDSMATVFSYGSTKEGAQAAWAAVAGTAPARALAAHGPVEVVVFEHFYSVGLPDPTTAEWIIIAYAAPVLETDKEAPPTVGRGALVVYPNPASHSMSVAFHITQEGPVMLRLFDMLGREVATRNEGYRPAGHTDAVLSLASLPSGVYFLRLEAGSQVERRAITVVR